MNSLLGTESAYDWSGLYMGVQFGMGTGEVDTTSGGNKISNRFSQGDNTTGGVLLGLNFQHGDIVYGLEGGLSINEIKANHNGSSGIAYHDSDYVWHAEARGRLGYAIGRFLPYIHGGITASEFYQQSANTGTGSTGNMQTVFGYQAGAGIDVRIGPKVSVRSEYVYQNYGKKNYNVAGVGTLSSDFDLHIARAALLYHFGNPVTKSDPATSNHLLFSGPSLGLNVGVSTGEVKLGGFSSGTIDLDTIAAGVRVGYLYPFNDFRIGAEAELAMHSGSEKTNPGGPLTKLQYRLMWHAAVRAKAGYVYDRYMPYVMAGANLGQFQTESSPSSNTNLDPYKKGWSVGAGLEYAFTDRISGDVAYSYNTYKKTDVGTHTGTTKIGHDFHQVRFGVVIR